MKPGHRRRWKKRNAGKRRIHRHWWRHWEKSFLDEFGRRPHVILVSLAAIALGMAAMGRSTAAPVDRSERFGGDERERMTTTR